jgi:hypothetical protein
LRRLQAYLFKRKISFLRSHFDASGYGIHAAPTIPASFCENGLGNDALLTTM